MSKAAAKLTESEEYLQRKMRKTEENLKSPSKKLIINTSAIDENGKSIKQHVGTFHIVGTDLYSETIRFRPLSALNKLIKMTKGKTKEGTDTWNYVNQTILFSNYGEVIYDAKGGTACGKVFGDARKALSPAQAEANNEKAKSFMYLFGLAQFPGEKEWHFVDLRVGGKRIMVISDAISNKNIGKTHFMSQFIYDMTCIAQAATIHPNLEMRLDQKAGIQDIASIIDYDNQISNYVEEHNSRIMATFKKYSTQAGAIVEDEEEINIDIGDDE